MAACGSMFENPTLLQSLSPCNQIKPIEQPAFTQVFGHGKRESFSWNAESLQFCTEGLGFESSDEVEDTRNEERGNKATRTTEHSTRENVKRSSSSSRGFPPPISCIGKSGKPCVCFKSYRQDGRFVLKQVRIPTQDFLHACREDGRLKLQFVHPNYDDQQSGEEE
ncbi:hypothetical protein V6N13_052095 [Hibiscus sabdariffa]|uniref:FAF domain-containing protein n=1 Tax=Hibiscus sabdariffa TaxID=183260 RepID=A0ABR2T5E1_9ROSI